jgi:hypothetical protein
VAAPPCANFANGEIVCFNGENLCFTQPRIAVYVRDTPNALHVSNSLVIILQVEFNGLTPENYVRLSWAKVTFEEAENVGLD